MPPSSFKSFYSDNMGMKKREKNDLNSMGNSGVNSLSNSETGDSCEYNDEQKPTSSSISPGSQQQTGPLFLALQSSLEDGNLSRRPIWVKHMPYQPDWMSLHDEIWDLYTYLKPTAEEICLRLFVFNRVRDVLSSLFPRYTINLVGSCVTHLFLPTSDIDISIDSPDSTELELHRVSDFLRHAEEFEDVHEILASVPLIKLTDRDTRFRIDISFNHLRNLRSSVEWVKRQKILCPMLEPLVLVLKQFLVEKNLSESFSGGLPSYALIVMVLHFIQKFPHNTDRGLGYCFVQFLRYFGEEFDHNRFGLTCWFLNSLGYRVPRLFPVAIKKEERKFDRSCIHCDPLWIQDPVLRKNNVGRGCYNFSAIRSEFSRGCRVIDEVFLACYSMPEVVLKESFVGPIISLIIHFSDEEVDVRTRRIDQSVELLRAREQQEKLKNKESLPL